MKEVVQITMILCVTGIFIYGMKCGYAIKGAHGESSVELTPTRL